jgi:hypothetical protein
MSELPNAQNMQMHPFSGKADSTPEIPLDLEGFTPQELARLSASRNRYVRGDMNEWTDDYKRLRFARWLYERGIIDG